jgi:competence ComEA-like helix-hairpin-helix protein
MAAAEHRAILLIVGLAVAGHGVRVLLLEPGDAPGGVELLDRNGDGSATGQRDSSARLSRPLGDGERIDLDQAGAEEIARLPRVGPALARRIAGRRDSLGRVGGLAGLDSVAGIGPGLLREIAPHVAFSRGAEIAPSGAVHGTAQGGSDGLSSTLAEGPPAAHTVNVNTASEQALTALPGIGPAKARAIVQWRSAHGPFRAVGDLARVPGIGPGILARMAQSVTIQ